MTFKSKRGGKRRFPEPMTSKLCKGLKWCGGLGPKFKKQYRALTGPPILFVIKSLISGQVLAHPHGGCVFDSLLYCDSTAVSKQRAGVMYISCYVETKKKKKKRTKHVPCTLKQTPTKIYVSLLFCIIYILLIPAYNGSYFGTWIILSDRDNHC